MNLSMARNPRPLLSPSEGKIDFIASWAPKPPCDTPKGKHFQGATQIFFSEGLTIFNRCSIFHSECMSQHPGQTRSLNESERRDTARRCSGNRPPGTVPMPSPFGER